MKIWKFLVAVFATIFGGRAQATSRPENPFTQATPAVPLAHGPDTDETSLLSLIMNKDEEVEPVVPEPAPIPHRLHEAVVTKWKGNICSAKVVEQVGDLLRLQRGNCGTFVRSMA